VGEKICAALSGGADPKISIHEKSLQHNNSYLLVIRIPKSAFFSNALSFAKM